MSLKSFPETTPYLFMFCSETWGFRTYFTSETKRTSKHEIIFLILSTIFLSFKQSNCFTNPVKYLRAGQSQTVNLPIVATCFQFQVGQIHRMLPRLVSLKCRSEVIILHKTFGKTLLMWINNAFIGASSCSDANIMQSKFNIKCWISKFYLDSDSFLREDLELWPVVGNVSEELLLIAIPLDAVQGVSLHVKPEVKISKGVWTLHYDPFKIHVLSLHAMG